MREIYIAYAILLSYFIIGIILYIIDAKLKSKCKHEKYFYGRCVKCGKRINRSK